ncbi:MULTISPECIES: PTS transporter subunit IIC [unclassified Actinomyces]|uniref:PTS galactitol transporter subunit IIC n=1 Tax=unclassified Actinomyces TaxID=2609248 RepID=UPI002017CE3A|nr:MULTISPECIES: PTS transporter subunit IIC [unclassified Actinomyces]MCL3777189.1 PTS galactitol transporter subunit IIC [Actinomyces sp. AC-20-1]MCL3788987.1 PTS galactitol transporter subunit IIC [Actinomyces sp. 187325]MCL3791342.1 PTS galactitol transporter subunit IIC [Actinomyces sp. 186855]MCL3793947.1 PTS galactitol transporter subunit IIC [Actinomyces sp. 217892]
MQVLTSSVDFVLSLGAAIFVPLIMIVAGLLVRMRIKDAISSGITLGVAFSGMTMLIGYMTQAITPAAEAMSETVGVSLPITDGGWTTMSTISWSWPYAALMFPLVVVINIILIVLKQTETFNADLWNVWGKIFTAVAVYYITGAVWLAFLIAAIQTVFELKAADFHQHRVETMTGIPGVTITHRMIFLAAPMYPVDWLLRKIPGLNRSFNAADLRDKVGILAENHILGFILGVLFGVLARFDVAATLILGIQAATALTLFPVISKYFMQALEPISNAISEFMQKRFNDRQLYVGLDWPFLGGSNEIWLAVIWTIPVTLLYSFFLPGNGILPFAGIVNVCVAVGAFFASRGNIIRMLIQCTIFAPVFLWVGTAFAPFMTELANSTGAVELAEGQLISNSSIDAPIFTYALSHLLQVLNGNVVPAIVLVVWVVCFVLYSRELVTERNAARAEAASAAQADAEPAQA